MTTNAAVRKEKETESYEVGYPNFRYPNFRHPNFEHPNCR